jgi:hypothetical protein
MKRSDWDHSKVIIGLLRQPDIDGGWQSYLIERHGHSPNPPLCLKFSKDTTSRSHGDSLQLQDLLELGAIDRDITAIIELAYDQGVRQGPAAAMESKPTLDPVVEEQESSSISPPTDVPQDSVMGSPSMESASLPPSSTSYFAASPMEFTAQSQQEMHQTPLSMDTNSMNMQSNFFPFSNDFNPSMFQTTSFMSNPHHSTSSFEKALPPLPVEEASVHSSDVNMLQSHTPNDPQVGAFDSWSMLSASTFTEDSNVIVMPNSTFDPRNMI